MFEKCETVLKKSVSFLFFLIFERSFASEQLCFGLFAAFFPTIHIFLRYKLGIYFSFSA